MTPIPQPLTEALKALAASQSQWFTHTSEVFARCIAVGKQLNVEKARIREETRLLSDSRKRSPEEVRAKMPVVTGREWSDFLAAVAEKFDLSDRRLREYMRFADIAEADPSILRDAHTIREAMRLANLLPECGQPQRDQLAITVQADRFITRFTTFWERAIPQIPPNERTAAAQKLRTLADQLEAAS